MPFHTFNVLLFQYKHDSLLQHKRAYLQHSLTVSFSVLAWSDFLRLPHKDILDLQFLSSKITLLDVEVLLYGSTSLLFSVLSKLFPHMAHILSFKL